MPLPTRTRPVLVLLAAAVLLAGCRDGKSSSGEPRKPDRPAAAPAPPVEPAPAALPPPPSGNPSPLPAPENFQPPASTQAVPPPAPAPPSAPATAPAAPLVLPPLTTRPDTQPDDAPPQALDALPPPSVGQFAVYTSTTAGAGTLLRQTVTAIGPGPNDATVTEQLLRDGQPVGPARTLIIPRVGRRWPRLLQTEARTVGYGRETIELAGQSLDCIVLTVESRSAGSVQVEKQWISGQAPATHLARMVVTVNGRELLRQELTDFGPRP